MNQNESTDNVVKEAGTQGEGFSPGRCPMDEQRRPGRYQATAKTKWNKQMHIAIMECYYMSSPVDEGESQSEAIGRECMMLGKKGA